MKTKTQFTNRILSLVLSIMMVISMLPMNVLTASAAEGDAASVTTAGEGGVTENYSSLTDAITAAQENAGSTLKLLEDVDTNVVIDGGTFTFDLNGHKIEADTEYHSIYLTKSYALTIETGADITLKGNGSIISNSPLTHTTPYGCIWNKGKLKIDGDIELKTNEYTYNSGIYNAPGGQLTIDNCSINVKRYAIDCYKSTATINGGSFQSAGTCLYVSGDASVTVKGGSFTGGSLDLSVIAPATLKLGVGDDGPGPIFPGGILAYNTVVLRDLLDENCYFEQNGAPVDMTDITNKITGDVSVVYCDHSQNTNTIPTADDASSHSLFCSDCGGRISQNNHSLDGGICTDCGYGCSHSSCITENNVTKCAHCPVVFVAQVGDAYFAKLSDAVAAAHGTKGSTLTLLADVKGDFAVNAGSVFALDLNGKTLRGTSHGSIITINTAAELTIKSSVSGGKITGCDNQTVLGTIFVYGTLKLESGKITGNSAEYGGGVVVGGTFVMNGGEITGNTALYYGGGVYVTGEGSFTMNGGSITNNTVTADGTHMQNEESIGGGGVSVAEGTFTMNGGTISSNNATHTKGGGVMVFSYLSKCGNFVMNGGSITGNAAGKKGGGVYLMGPGENQTVGSFTVNGNSVISGNTVKGEANNVYLETPLSIGSDLSTTASVGITASTTPTDAGLEIASSGATEKNKSAFVSDNINYAIVQKAGKLYLYPHIHSWVYTKDGEKITAACEASGCTAPDGGYVTIAAPSGLTYTGSKIEAVVDNKLTTGDTVAVEYTKDPIDVGSYTASITLDGKTISVTYRIAAASIRDANVLVGGTAYTYDGTAKEPTSITVTMGGKTLTKDTDYTVSYSDNVNAGTATVTVTGKGNYSGTKTATFSIAPMELDETNTVVTLDQNTFVYDGTEHKPAVTVTFNGATLTEGVDYRVFYSQPMRMVNGKVDKWFGDHTTSVECVNVDGDYYAVVVGLGNFRTKDAFTLYANFVIEKATVTEPTIASKPYSGSAQTADVTDTDLYTVVKNEGGTGVKENGCYDVVLELKDSANYKWSTTDNAQVTLQFKITRAENEWTVDPSITGWTYGEAAKAPVGEAKFGEVSVEYSGTMNGGAAYNGVAAPTEAGSYTATFIVQETEDYKGLETSVDFTIAKADQAAPTGLTKTDTTYFGKADGKISGLTSAMEFRKEGDSAYTAGFNGTLEYLAAGTYYVRYQGDANHNPSPDAVVTVNAGRKLQIVVPQNQVGYTVTVNKTEMEYEGSYTLKVEIHEGYTATENFKIIISNWECGQQAGVEETYMNAIADQIIEVRGVADLTPPAAEIKVKENKWTSFWNNLTFGLFFKETQDVTITTTDKGSGVKSIQYYLASGELELDEVRAITDWVGYNGTFKIDPNNRYVVYAKVTDNAGNTLYINSDCIILDNIAPTLEGIENGKTYYGDLTVIKSDEQFYDIKAVTLDGEEMGFAEGTYGLIPADNAEHIVVVEDHAGNKTTYTVTVYKNYTVTYKADGEPISTETVGHGKDANLPAVPAKNGYVGKWDSDGKNITGDTTITVVYTEIPVVKPNEVKPEDKTDLEDTKKQLEDMLKDDSYTDEDKKNIQDAIDDIDDALEVIGNVEAVAEVIYKLPAVDTVKPDDEEAIKAITDAQTAYNALSDYEKSLVDEATKAALDKLAAALVAYDIVEGDGSSWTEDSDHNITFVVNGLFSKFVGIKVDGKDVDKANYEVKAGSTIITLKASYLDTLAVGEHTITVVYTDGSTDGAFNVHAKANSPVTGDNSNMFLWVALLFISGGAVITLTVVERKKRVATKR